MENALLGAASRKSNAHAYDNLVRQEYTTDGVPYVTTYDYDAAHRLVALGSPGGREAQFAYDAVGRLSEVGTTVGGSPRTLARH